MEIKRDYYLNKLIEAKNDKLIKIIMGIRRCGKSYLLEPKSLSRYFKGFFWLSNIQAPLHKI